MIFLTRADKMGYRTRAMSIWYHIKFKLIQT